MDSILHGSIVEELSEATGKYALVIGGRRWKLYVKEAQCDYQRTELPDVFILIDLVGRQIAIRKDCEEKILPFPNISPDISGLVSTSFVKKLGTFVPIVGTTPIYPAVPAGVSGIPPAIPAGPIGTQLSIFVGQPLTITGNFEALGNSELIPRELIILSIPSTAIAPPSLPLDSINVQIPPPNGIIVGYVTAYIPGTQTVPGSLTMQVFFTTLTIPFISESLLQLLNPVLQYIFGSKFLSELGLSSLIPGVISLLSGPVLNGQALEISGLVGVDNLKDALQALRL